MGSKGQGWQAKQIDKLKRQIIKDKFGGMKSLSERSRGNTYWDKREVFAGHKRLADEYGTPTAAIMTWQGDREHEGLPNEEEMEARKHAKPTHIVRPIAGTREEVVTPTGIATRRYAAVAKSTRGMNKWQRREAAARLSLQHAAYAR